MDIALFAFLWCAGWWLIGYGVARLIKSRAKGEWEVYREPVIMLLILSPLIVGPLLMLFIASEIFQEEIEKCFFHPLSSFFKAIGLCLIGVLLTSGSSDAQHLYILKSFNDPDVLATEVIRAGLRTPGPTHAFESDNVWYTEWHGAEGHRPMVYRLRSKDSLTSQKDSIRATQQIIFGQCKQGGI